ncbi:HAD family hydrolase [Sagittula sp. NFXS13]|uniref:HAD family hydrolase n=1 Tax=Sagittula sp. NFXS13 TaxID=2819095 RepID=UPI0032DF40FC
MTEVRAVLFDKDGTLFDFGGTWNAFATRLLKRLGRGDAVLTARAAEVIGFDLRLGRYRPDSPAIAGTNREVALLLASVLPQKVGALVAAIDAEAEAAPLVEAVPLVPFLEGLRARGLKLGVMTNDSEAVAYTHLAAVGVKDHFDFIAGADSGFGAKPAPDPLLAFADAMGLAPAEVVMVGDSRHDLIAAERAGMRRVAVLTGMADRAALGRYAETVLPDIGHLPAWLDGAS